VAKKNVHAKPGRYNKIGKDQNETARRCNEYFQTAESEQMEAKRK
jgi:hypothetical protein